MDESAIVGADRPVGEAGAGECGCKCDESESLVGRFRERLCFAADVGLDYM